MGVSYIHAEYAHWVNYVMGFQHFIRPVWNEIEIDFVVFIAFKINSIF